MARAATGALRRSAQAPRPRLCHSPTNTPRVRRTRTPQPKTKTTFKPQEASPRTQTPRCFASLAKQRCLFPAGDRTRVQITRELLCTLCTGWNHVRGWGHVARRIPKWYHPQRCPASLLLSGAGAHVVLAVTVAVLCGAAAVACAVAGQEPGDCSHCPREGQHRVLWAPRGAVSASGHSMRSQAHRQLGPRRRSWGRAGGVDKTRQARRVGSPPGSV